MQSRPLPQPLPASAWGADTARIHARLDEYRASLDPRDDDAEYRDALRLALLPLPY